MIIKNSNIRRNLFSNRYVIFMIIFAIILVFCVIQVINNFAKEQLKQKNANIQNVTNTETTHNPEKTVISGKDVTKPEQQKNENVIDTFIKYCNNNQVEQAYSLLSNDCKEEEFGDRLQNFKTSYVDKVFTSKKNYSIQSWINKQYTTYRVTISEDIMATGKTSLLQDSIEDYYTIVEENGQKKLNINSYIVREKINKENQVSNIKIEVIQKDIYREYEVYKVKVTNNTENTILLDSRQDTKSVYLEGDNNKKYQAFMYEVMDTKLVINKEQEKTMDIRFNKVYSNNIQMEKMVLEDIILDYEAYKNIQNKQDYTNRMKMSINIK